MHAAIPPALRVGLVHECGGAALLLLAEDGAAGQTIAQELVGQLQQRDWDGDQVLADLLTSATGGPPTGRPALKVDLDALADVRSDATGGWLDLREGLCWPQEVFDDADPEIAGDPDESPDRWLEVDSEGSRPGWQDMSDFVETLDDPAAVADLTTAIHGTGAFRRFQQALDRHEEYRAAWRVHTSERRTARARAWLAESGYDAVP